MNKKRIFIIVSVIIVLLILLCVLYAFFVNDVSTENGNSLNNTDNILISNDDKEQLSSDSNDDYLNNMVNIGSAPPSTVTVESVISDIELSANRRYITKEVISNAENYIRDMIFHFIGKQEVDSYKIQNALFPTPIKPNNWIYIVSHGGDLAALLGGSYRDNIEIMDIQSMTDGLYEEQIPELETVSYSVTYRFTAIPEEIMEESGALVANRDGIAHVFVTLDPDGKIVEYIEESIEWK